jgi:hypothetical protein
LALVQLFNKNLSVDSTDTLDGKRAEAYSVLNKDNNYAIVYGPFSEKKQIQIMLYWENSMASGFQPVEDNEIKEVRIFIYLFSSL